jgi:two-component system phosphate regulon sensor histidine kinase PhoR
MVLAFALPFIFLHTLITSTRRRASDEHNEVKHMRSMLAELSEHVQHDQSLIMEALGVPFLLMRPSGRVVMANQKAAALFGMEQMNNTNLLRVMPDSELKQFLQKAVSSTEKVRAMTHVSRPEGERIYRATATHLATRERHIGIVFLDMTEEHRTQVIRREFIANASHELRTPLTLILGYLETLLDSPEAADDAEMRRRSLEIMKRHADRMARLVSDMLMLSRVETPNTSYLKQEEFDFRQLTGDVLQRLESAIAAQKAEVELDVEPLQLMGDSFYWSQVLFNLLENALKNNPAPGLRIRLSAHKDEAGTCRIQVEDNGTGISPEALPFIFNRFYRADQTGKVKGTGLGLAIVKHAVEAHGGSIRAESAPGVRTAFIITQPREVIND